MPAPLLSLKDIGLSIGSRTLFKDLSLHIMPGDRVTLVGRNGAGKSTLLKVMADALEPDTGERLTPKGLTVSYLAQEPDIGPANTLEDFVLSGLLDSQEGEDYRAAPLMAALSIRGNRAIATASGGEVRRAALARALISEPDLLLLDEPTNHLDIVAIEWLEDYLVRTRTAYVLISHDRALLSKLARATLWLDRGQVRRFDGSFSDFPAWQEGELEREALERHKLNKLIAEETRWSVEGISARRKRNMGRVRRLHDLRAQRRAQIQDPGKVKLSADSAATSGKLVFEAKSISKAYGEKTLFQDLSFRVQRADRLALIGPNGAGKTSLVTMLLGDTEPDNGSLKRGTNLHPLVLDQKRDGLKDSATVAEVLSGGSGDWVVASDGSKKHVRSVMKDFLFSPDHANSPVSTLSGGERNRLLLARGLVNPSNLMILDEPTNDLDLDTLDLLVELLADYQGTLILVSHDRDFIDQLATTSLVLDGKGGAHFCAGGFTDAQNQLGGAFWSSVTGPIIASQKAETPAVKRPASRAKLSYKDQRELDTLPADIETLEARKAALEAKLAEPDLFKRDPDAFAAASKELGTIGDSIEAKEIRWLELEELQELLASR